MAEKEYIERKDLINNRPPQRNPDQTGKEEYNKGYNDGIKAVLSCIEIQPAADVAPVRHGHWDKPTKPFPHYDWKCSVCGCEEYRQIDSHGHYRVMKFCPNCGAKMDEEENDEQRKSC